MVEMDSPTKRNPTAIVANLATPLIIILTVIYKIPLIPY